MTHSPLAAAPLAADSLADCLAELAGVFGAPLDAADIAAIVANGRFEALSALAGDPRHAADLASAITALSVAGDGAAATAALNAAYCRLFLGLGPEPASIPIESAHHGSGRLFQQPVADIAALLAERGLSIAAGCGEPADHLSIQLALLEQLIRLQENVVGSDERDNIDALRRRLLTWTPHFAAAVGRADPSGFYAALARVLVRLLDDAAPRHASAA